MTKKRDEALDELAPVFARREVDTWIEEGVTIEENTQRSPKKRRRRAPIPSQ